MSLTGILLDVSGSMEKKIGSGTDEEGGPWAQSIFKVIDDLIEHDLTSENRVFAIGFGAECRGKEIFDVIRTVEQIENMEMPSYLKKTPATIYNIGKIFDIVEKNGARNIRKWADDISLIQETASDYMAALILRKLESDAEFLRKFVYEFLPSGCRDTVPTLPYPLVLGALSLMTLNPIVIGTFLVGYSPNVLENIAVSAASSARSATREDIENIVEKAKSYFLKDVEDHSIFSVQNASRIIRGYVNEKELSSKRKKELLENVEPFIYGGTPLYGSLVKAIKLFEGDTSENKLLFVLSDGEPADGSIKDIAKINQITSELNEAGVKTVSCFITRSTDIHPKRLYDKIPPPGWEPGAKFLFSLSSTVPTRDLPP